MKFDGDIIYAERDEFGLIQVVQNPVSRKLYFDSDVEQSCLYLNAPMQLNFEYQQIMVDAIEAFLQTQSKRPTSSAFRVLMLGMGGGSMAHYLFHRYPQVQITLVELRQAVIDCAYDYFYLPNEPEIEVVQEDAIAFMQQNLAPYDCILVDIFDAHGVPPHATEPQFQNNLWQALATNGLLLMNLWFQWQPPNESSNGKKQPLKMTAETQQIAAFWQNFAKRRSSYQLKRYNASSTQNLILQLTQTG